MLVLWTRPADRTTKRATGRNEHLSLPVSGQLPPLRPWPRPGALLVLQAPRADQDFIECIDRLVVHNSEWSRKANCRTRRGRRHPEGRQRATLVAISALPSRIFVLRRRQHLIKYVLQFRSLEQANNFFYKSIEELK